MPKTRLNISLDQDLAEFAKDFASENRTSVADVFTQYLLALRRRVRQGREIAVLSNPAILQALEDSRELWFGGSAEHGFSEVRESTASSEYSREEPAGPYRNAQESPYPYRRPGSAQGMFVMDDDFDDPLEDFSDYS